MERHASRAQVLRHAKRIFARRLSGVARPELVKFVRARSAAEREACQGDGYFFGPKLD